MERTMSKIITTDQYLKPLPREQRAALEVLRKQILSVIPDAEEHFGYGLPGFKLYGHPLIYFGAASKHCALYGSVPAGFSEQLKGFKHSKGAIQFTAENPLPAKLVKDIVRAKLAEHELRWGAERTKRAVKKAPVKEAKKTVVKVKKAKDGSADVDAYMIALKHPQKDVIQAVREAIVNADKRMQERVKWNAPSFYHIVADGRAMDFAAFNPRAKGFVQLILLFPMGVVDDPTQLMRGNWKDRREARFADMAEVTKKKSALNKLVKAWLQRIEP
jgi:uncharacterized protein YdhG (YjbR/CyaY superfamily)